MPPLAKCVRYGFNSSAMDYISLIGDELLTGDILSSFMYVIFREQEIYNVSSPCIYLPGTFYHFLTGLNNYNHHNSVNCGRRQYTYTSVDFNHDDLKRDIMFPVNWGFVSLDFRHHFTR